jgi:hypothetical protein
VPTATHTARVVGYLPTGIVHRFLLALSVVAAFTAIVWAGTRAWASDKPAGRAAPAKDFVWGDRVPLTKVMLAQWLRAHGSSYSAWASRHPAAARRLAK